MGATAGLFALLLTALVALTNRATRRTPAGWTLLALAGLLASLMCDRPTVAAAALFWTVLTVAALLPRRSSARASAWDWLGRLSLHAALSLRGPLRDRSRVGRLYEGAGRPSLRAMLSLLLLPIGGGAAFLALFAGANPVIAEALSSIRLPALDIAGPFRLLFGAVVLVLVWAVLRPPGRGKAVARKRPSSAQAVVATYLAPTPVTLALVTFNLLFALENGLDVAFLWSGAGLPAGVTLAGYAHQGAYLLVATALLAGAFALTFLREGSPTAERPLIRVLVGLWLAQNIFLVASSILRTVDYLEVYALTRFRIAALLWMGTVAVGLALTGWRVWRRKSAVWLVNANAGVLAAVLALVSAVDIGEVAAGWNVAHARDAGGRGAGGRGASLDLCYLARLGPSAVRPLLTLERRPLGPQLGATAAWVRYRAVRELGRTQADWHGWTWRGARRLQAARAHGVRPSGIERDCDSTPLPSRDAVTALVSSFRVESALTAGSRLRRWCSCDP